MKERAYNPTGKLMLNPCWPNPGYPIDRIIKVTKEEFDIPKDGSRAFDDMYSINNLKPEVREQVLQVSERYKSWHEIFDDNWKRYFLKFLKGYNFDIFTCFDFFGAPMGEVDPSVGLVDESQIILMQRIYERLASEYYENPSKYDYEDPMDCDVYLYQYQGAPFTVLQTTDEINEAITRAKALNKPMTEEEQEAYKKRYALSE